MRMLRRALGLVVIGYLVVAVALPAFRSVAHLADTITGSGPEQPPSADQAGRRLPAPAPAAHPGVAMPNPRLTPGAIYPHASVATVCRRGYTQTVRNVPLELKRRVYAAYHLPYLRGRDEADHLVSLELGGANRAAGPGGDIANLWPQPYASPAGAHQKDGLENWLHHQVCHGHLTLTSAQRLIATDWYAAWLNAGRPAPNTRP